MNLCEPFTEYDWGIGSLGKSTRKRKHVVLSENSDDRDEHDTDADHLSSEEPSHKHHKGFKKGSYVRANNMVSGEEDGDNDDYDTDEDRYDEDEIGADEDEEEDEENHHRETKYRKTRKDKVIPLEEEDLPDDDSTHNGVSGVDELNI